jgi:hypothetical protein
LKGNGEITLPREFDRMIPDNIYLTDAALADFNVTHPIIYLAKCINQAKLIWVG